MGWTANPTDVVSGFGFGGDGDDLDLTKRVSIGRAADLAGVTYADIQARIDQYWEGVEEREG